MKTHLFYFNSPGAKAELTQDDFKLIHLCVSHTLADLLKLSEIPNLNPILCNSISSNIKDLEVIEQKILKLL